MFVVTYLSILYFYGIGYLKLYFILEVVVLKFEKSWYNLGDSDVEMFLLKLEFAGGTPKFSDFVPLVERYLESSEIVITDYTISYPGRTFILAMLMNGKHYLMCLCPVGASLYSIGKNFDYQLNDGCVRVADSDFEYKGLWVFSVSQLLLRRVF